MNTVEQQRAKNALKTIGDLEKTSDKLKKPDEFKKRYRAYADRLGPTIVMNGLGQALATELAAAGSKPENEMSEGERAHKALYDNLQGWICREDGGIYQVALDDRSIKFPLLTAITKEDESKYLLAQTEALAWLEWHKKFCRASFPQGEEE